MFLSLLSKLISFSFSMEKIKQSNSTLTEFNNFSQSSYNNIVKDFNGHTRMIKDMKKDLDYIFKKIRYVLILLTLTFTF